MSTATVTTCHCPRCKVEAAGLGPGPYTPEQFKVIAPVVIAPSAPDPVADDPGVKAAELQVRTAREEWEPLHAAWLQAVAAHQAAEMAPDPQYSDGRGGTFSLGQGRRRRRKAELAEQVKETRDVMEAAWARVVTANTRVAEATLAARVREAEAARGG